MDLTRRQLLVASGGVLAAASGLAAGNSREPHRSTPETDLEVPLSVSWQESAEDTITEFVGVAEETLYTVVREDQRRRVVTRRVTDGAEEDAIGPEGVLPEARLSDGRLVLATPSDIRAYEVPAGRELWVWPTESDIVRVSAVTDGKVCVSEGIESNGRIETGRLVLLADGEVEQTVSTEWVPWIQRLPDETVIYVDGPADVREGSPASAGGTIVRYDPASDERIWETYDLGATVGGVASEGVVALAGRTIALFDTETGKQTRRANLPATPVATTHDEERLFFALDSSTVIAVRRADWTIVWRRSFEGALHNIIALSEQVLLGSENRMHILNPEDGATVWQSQLENTPTTNLELADGRVFTASPEELTTYFDRRIEVGEAIQAASDQSSILDHATAPAGELTGRQKLLAQARSAHEAGEYDRAMLLVERANRRQTLTAAGGTTLGLSGIYTTLRYRSRWRLRAPRKRLEALESQYPIETGVLAEEVPSGIQTALSAELESMQADRGTLRIKSPATVSDSLLNAADSLIDSHDRLIDVSEQLANFSQRERFRSAWKVAFMEELDQTEPEIEPLLDKFAVAAPRYRKAAKLAERTPDDIFPNSLAEEIRERVSEIAVPDGDLSTPLLNALDAVLEAESLFVTNAQVLQRYDITPIVESLQRWVSELEVGHSSDYSTEVCQAASRIIESVVAIENTISTASVEDAKKLDVVYVRRRVQQSIDAVDEEATVALADCIGDVITRTWTETTVAHLTTERLTEAVYEALTSDGYELQQIIQSSEKVYLIRGSSSSEQVVVVITHQSEADIGAALDGSHTIDKVLVVGQTERGQSVAKSAVATDLPVETLSYDELAELLNSSQHPPVLP